MNRIAQFEMVSKEQFESDFKDMIGFGAVESAMKEVNLPTRSTSGSAGYDIASPISFIINPGEEIKFPTGLRCFIEDGWVLTIVPRSSIGFKYCTILANTIGVIDSDYYNAKNEGHIWIKLKNLGSKPLEICAGDRVCQGIFLPYGVTKDDTCGTLRDGGIGSTGV